MRKASTGKSEKKNRHFTCVVDRCLKAVLSVSNFYSISFVITTRNLNESILYLNWMNIFYLLNSNK